MRRVVGQVVAQIEHALNCGFICFVGQIEHIETYFCGTFVLQGEHAFICGNDDFVGQVVTQGARGF